MINATSEGALVSKDPWPFPEMPEADIPRAPDEDPFAWTGSLTSTSPLPDVDLEDEALVRARVRRSHPDRSIRLDPKWYTFVSP